MVAPGKNTRGVSQLGLGVPSEQMKTVPLQVFPPLSETTARRRRYSGYNTLKLPPGSGRRMVSPVCSVFMPQEGAAVLPVWLSGPCCYGFSHCVRRHTVPLTSDTGPTLPLLSPSLIQRIFFLCVHQKSGVTLCCVFFY